MYSTSNNSIAMIMYLVDQNSVETLPLLHNIFIDIKKDNQHHHYRYYHYHGHYSCHHRRVSRNSQEGGGPKSESPFFFCFSIFHSLIFALMTFFFFFCFSISRGGAGPLGPPPLDTRLHHIYHYYYLIGVIQTSVSCRLYKNH